MEYLILGLVLIVAYILNNQNMILMDYVILAGIAGLVIHLI